MVEARLDESGQAPVRGEQDEDRHSEATSLARTCGVVPLLISPSGFLLCSWSTTALRGGRLPGGRRVAGRYRHHHPPWGRKEDPGRPETLA